MLTRTVLLDGPVSVAAYRCTFGPANRPFAEQHRARSISYVQRGSFGCACRGRRYELVPGSVLLGAPGDEYVCTHDHHDDGDTCLAFFFDPALLDGIGEWPSGALPPLAPVMSLAELASDADGVGPDLTEVGLALAARVADAVAGGAREPVRPRALDRRRAIESALWIDAHCSEASRLPQLAARADMSAHRFLRMFDAVLGVTPHQYLVRSRLKHAARLLRDSDLPVTDIAYGVGFEDLSNFVRTFRRAAGLSPRDYRRAARGTRNFLQDRIGRRS